MYLLSMALKNVLNYKSDYSLMNATKMSDLNDLLLKIYSQQSKVLVVKHHRLELMIELLDLRTAMEELQ